jgi:hypothetical protein
LLYFFYEDAKLNVYIILSFDECKFLGG